MAYATISIRFYLKKDASPNHRGFPIYCRISCQRKKAELYTGENCMPDKWNEAAGAPLRDLRLKDYLSHVEETIRQNKRQLEMDGREVSAKILKEIFRGKGPAEAEAETPVPLVDFFNEQLHRISRLSRDYTPGTLQHYRTTLGHVKAYLAKLKEKDIPVQEVDHKFIQDFDYYLMTTPGEQSGQPMGRNTANKYHTKLKTILLQALKEGILSTNPYAEFKLKNKTVHREHLTKEELQRIRELKFENLSLDKVRDIFLFSCYTGLRFTDAQELRKQDVHPDEDGNYWIYLKQQKTDEPLAIPVLNPALELYHKYDHLREVTGRIIPSFVNQKVNTYLKIIADFANVKKKLTHHVARHTFATTVLLENDVPLEAVQAYLGHTTSKTTAIYARMTNKYKMKIAHRLNEKI
ncbi:MAG: site-specific integrase [Saprospiraceae bacterium]|nr:site-specific integrase [Saprospiraceae bacterium]